MTTSGESSSETMEDTHSPATPQSPPPPPLPSSIPTAKIATTTVENAASWIDDAMRQALVYQNTIVETLDSTIDASKSRLSRIRDTSIAHTSQTIDSIREIASEYNVYEHMVFAKIKDGVNVAASHPLISGGLAFGVGVFALKKTRRFVYYNAIRMFSSEEALLSRADLRVKELRQSLDRLTAESEKLERVATVAEDELIRGRMKLRQAGKQIRGVVSSAYKIEKQAAGLKDVLKELPTREASRFRSQISNRASEIKQERKALTKEVNKISNYGISV
ncbi:Alanine-tRNA ligase [Hirschfeldia incana]|nr:Alanine-tRNA ligase [Hirschfeldia incana]